MINISFIAAVLPVALLLIFIYRKDKYQPEPLGKLLLAFVAGCFCILPASIMEAVLMLFTPDDAVVDGIYTGYAVAGCSEELCKLVLLMMVIWRSRHFDEFFDGIVYAVFVSLGFACVENIMYVTSNDDPVMIAFMRGILAVPAHFLFAVTMGYYVSLAKFDPLNKRSHLFKAFFYPMLLHGTYDALLMVSDALGSSSDDEDAVVALAIGILTLVFIVFDIIMWRRGMKRIKRMQERSKEQSFDRMHPFDGFRWDF